MTDLLKECRDGGHPVYDDGLIHFCHICNLNDERAFKLWRMTVDQQLNKRVWEATMPYYEVKVMRVEMLTLHVQAPSEEHARKAWLAGRLIQKGEVETKVVDITPK